MAAQGYANGEGALVTTAEDKSRPSGIYEELLPSQIRLVEVLPGEFEDPIELRIKVVDLEDEPLYDALSYVWHPKDGTVDTSRPLNRAKLVGHEVFLIAIGANLDSAIRHLRAKVSTSSAPQKLWIDALCINQSDSRERNHQVGLMKNIYSSAHQVLIWLGPAVGKSDFCIQVLRSGCLDHQDANRFLQALSALIYRSWFTRLWVAQELTLAREDPIVYVGHESVYWSRIALAVQKPSQKQRVEEAIRIEPDYLNNVFTPSRHNMYSLAVYIAGYEKIQELANMRHDGPSATFGHQFFRAINLRSSDPRDKVFGLLGVASFANDDRTITPDYNKSVSEVSRETTVAVLKSHFVSYIKSQPWLYAEMDLGSNHADESPTWTINLRYISYTGRPEPFTAAYETDMINGLKRTRGVAPIIEFSKDQSTILTVGMSMGHVVAIDDPIPCRYNDSIQYLDKLTMVSRLLGMEISAEEILSTLIGPYDTQGFDYDALIPEVKEQLFNESFDWGSFKEAMMTRYLSHGVMFLTKEGYMGVYYRNYEREDDVDGTLVATALFGIRLPFILKRVASGRYKLWALAHFNGHKLGDEHVEAMGPDDDWRDLVKQGKMEEFVIV